MGTMIVLAVAVAAVVGLAIALMLTRRQRAGAGALVAELKAELESQRDASMRSAVDTLVTIAREQLGAQTEAGTKALDSRNELMDQRLDAMHGELDRVRKLVQELEQDRQRSFGALSEQLKSAGSTTAELAELTRGLRETLSNSRTRGQWGERMAEDLLRAAGFVEGVNYVRQTTTAAGRPDVTFLLPGERVLHMDVKFPLDNYVRAIEAGDDDRARAEHDKAFLRDVRGRITELADRGYGSDSSALDEVLLFIPNDQVFAYVQQQDTGLVDEALRRHVILCAPATLFAVLAVVRQAADAVSVQERATEILDLLAGFSDQWERFVAQMDKLGDRLDAARRDYDALTTTRRRQLERQLEKLDDVRGDRGEAGRSALHAIEGGGAAVAAGE